MSKEQTDTNSVFDQPNQGSGVGVTENKPDDFDPDLLRDFPDALKNKDFKIYLQPQYNYESGKIIGAEALVRWVHPKRGLIMPNTFIRPLEHRGLITQLDRFVWEEACSFIRKTIDSGVEPIPISVNVSVMDLRQCDIVEIFVDLIDRYAIPVQLLQLEITESTYMENPARISSLVSELQQRGFSVEIDDFGSGYSSLNTLKNIACDVLKLDMGFIDNNVVGSRGGNILNSVVRMAHWLKTPVIAEGVETYEQAEYLKSIGCVFMQGYYFARPMSVEDFQQHMNYESENLLKTKYRESNIDNAERFWDISSQEALLFNSFVGGACITEYDNHHVEDI